MKWIWFLVVILWAFMGEANAQKPNEAIKNEADNLFKELNEILGKFAEFDKEINQTAVDTDKELLNCIDLFNQKKNYLIEALQESSKLINSYEEMEKQCKVKRTPEDETFLKELNERIQKQDKTDTGERHDDILKSGRLSTNNFKSIRINVFGLSSSKKTWDWIETNLKENLKNFVDTSCDEDLDLKSDVEKAQKKLEEVTKDHDDLEKGIENKKGSAKKFSEESEDLKSKNQNLKNDVKKLKDEVQEIITKRDEATKDLNDCQDENETLNKTYSTNDVIYKNLTEENKKCLDNLEAIKRNTTDLTKTNADYKSDLAECQKKKDSIENEKNQCEQNLAKSKPKEEECEKRVKKCEDEKKKLQKENAELEKENQNCEDKRDECNEKKKDCEKEKTKCEEDLNNAKKNNAKLTEELEHCHKNETELADGKKALEKDLDDRKTSLGECEMKVKSLEGEVNQLTTINKDLKEKLKYCQKNKEETEEEEKDEKKEKIKEKEQEPEPAGVEEANDSNFGLFTIFNFIRDTKLRIARLVHETAQTLKTRKRLKMMLRTNSPQPEVKKRQEIDN